MVDFCGFAAHALSLAPPLAAPDWTNAAGEPRSSVMLNLRFLLAVLLLATTAVFLQAHGRVEHMPSRLPLASFPKELNGWNGSDVSIDQDVLDVLGAGDFLLRVYRPQENNQPYVDLFIAY